MELIQQKRRRLQVPPIAIHLHLSFYLRFVFGLSLGVGAVATGMAALPRLMQSPTNPFSDYADILPGQPRSALILHGFACAESGAVTPSRPSISQYCVLLPKTGAFDHIGAIVSSSVIMQVYFSVRDDASVVGDLAKMWGRPEIGASYREWVTLYWPGSGFPVRAQAEPGRFSYFLPLRRVIFGAL